MDQKLVAAMPRSNPHVSARQVAKPEELGGPLPHPDLSKIPTVHSRDSLLSSGNLPLPFFSEASRSESVAQAAVEDGNTAWPTPYALEKAWEKVQIRNDARADRSARLIRAQAFALGSQVYFRQGALDSTLKSGGHLLAHELAHVAHQTETGNHRPQRFVGGDVLTVQYTHQMAQAMTEEELSDQMKLLRKHLQNAPKDIGAAENLAVLEQVAYERQGTAGTVPSPDVSSKSGQPSPGADSEKEEEHGTTWQWLHKHGLANTRHERADNLRRAWGPPEVVFDENGEVIQVDKLSDKEIVELNTKLLNQPRRSKNAVLSASPTLPSGWTRGPFSAFGREVGWPERGKVVTPAESVDLDKLRRAGVTEEWATKEAATYRDIARLNPKNPSAAMRAEWLEKVAARLRSGK